MYEYSYKGSISREYLVRLTYHQSIWRIITNRAFVAVRCLVAVRGGYWCCLGFTETNIGEVGSCYVSVCERVHINVLKGQRFLVGQEKRTRGVQGGGGEGENPVT